MKTDTEPAGRLPAYAGQLAAYHRACRRELRKAVADVPLPPAGRVLDIPCGDGFYTAALAGRLFPDGSVVAADLSPAFLRLAERTYAKGSRQAPAEFVQADAYHLPFADDSFDVVWCAQSLITFAADPIAALGEMRRVARPGGVVAVLESDEFHHVMLNCWPVGLELAIQHAIAAAARKKFGGPAKLSPSRGARRMLKAAGLVPGSKRTYTADRQAPFDKATAAFLAGHLAEVRRLVAPHLSPPHLAALDRFADPDEPDGVFRREDAEVTCLNTLFVARK